MTPSMFDTPANPELSARDAVLDRFETSRPAILAVLRRGMRELYARQVDSGVADPFVCADDVRSLLDSLPGEKPECLNFLGAVFKEKGWRATGRFVKSTTRGSHGNLIQCWRWEG